MNQAALELPAALAGFVGRKGATLRAPDPVNAAMIRHWCAALGDRNPVYADEAAARASVHGGLIAPPAMLQAWTMPGYGAAPAGPDAVAELYAVLDSLGYTSIVATDSEQDYLRALRHGDAIAATKTIASISPEKTTALGKGHFVTSTIEIVDARGETVGRQLHRVLKFKPPAHAKSAPSAAPLAHRPRPNTTLDTRFFFEGARAGKLLIQCCKACGHLQHPPTPACARCGALDLGTRQASGRGELYSFTVVHAPVVPPFKPPYIVALVALDEGTRVVSELVGVAPEAARIGMKLAVEFAEVDDGLILPVFRPAGERERLPPLVLPIDRSFIVASALASRDYQPVHHDPDYARRGGSQDIFMNILTTQGLVGRYATDWAGPNSIIRRIAIRLGASNYPGDTMILQGEVASRRPGQGGEDVELEIRGANKRGDHVKGRVVLTLCR